MLNYSYLNLKMVSGEDELGKLRQEVGSPGKGLFG
jgi:hypothetical protein